MVPAETRPNRLLLSVGSLALAGKGKREGGWRIFRKNEPRKRTNLGSWKTTPQQPAGPPVREPQQPVQNYQSHHLGGRGHKSP